MELKPETHAPLNALNRRQREFVRLLVRDPRRNQAKAYRRAGYDAADDEVAASNASRLMGNERVRAAYEALRADYQHQFDVDSAQIVEALAKLAFHDPRELLDENGRLRPVQELGEDAAAGMRELEVERTTVHQAGEVRTVEQVVKVRCYDRHAALRTLAQIKGLMTTKVEHSGLPNWEKVVAEAGRA